ncbi:MAG: hypothetical protein V4538_17110 [Bacteroidota bacterium]
MESNKKYLHAFNKVRLVLLKVLMVTILVGIPIVLIPQESNPTEKSEPAIVPKGYQGKRYFGDLLTQYTIDSTGKIVVCTLYVSTVLVGIESLTATNPIYKFDVKAGLGAANGTLTLNLTDSPLISNLKGDFTYTVTGNNTSFSFKGDLVGWYTHN